MPRKASSTTRTQVVSTVIRGGTSVPSKSAGQSRPKKKKKRANGPGSGPDGDYARYLAVLRDPFSCPPVRLGGTSCHTGLVTQRSRFVVNMSGRQTVSGGSTQSDTISILFCPFPAGFIDFTTFTQTNATNDYAYVNSAWTSSSIVPSTASLISNIADCRPIAAGIRLRLIASTSNDQGEAVAACLGTGIPVQQTNANTWMEMDEHRAAPARDGIWATWRPQDSTSFQFNSAYLTGGGIPPNTASWTSSDLPVIGIGFTNMSTTNPPTVVIETYCHWETIVNPASNGLIATSVGLMSANHQNQTLTGSVLSSLGEAMGTWLKPAYQGINETIQTGLYQSAKMIAGQQFVRGAARVLPLLM